MKHFVASPAFSPRPDTDEDRARDSITLDALPELVKAVLASPFLEHHLARLHSDEYEGMRVGVFQGREATDREVTVIIVHGGSSDFRTGELMARFGLTRREAQVALLLAKRLSGKEIGRKLGFSRFTAARHTEQVLIKLGVRSRRDVATVLASWMPAVA